MREDHDDDDDDGDTEPFQDRSALGGCSHVFCSTETEDQILKT